MRHWRGGAAALVAAVVWAVFARNSPSSTYHFAPSVVAAAWVVLEGTSEAGLTARRTLQLGVLGFLVAGVFTFGLSLAGSLEGPVFWSHADNAPVEFEHILFAVLGALIGVGVSIRHAARPSTVV